MFESEEEYYAKMGQDYLRRRDSSAYTEDLLNDKICILDPDLPYQLVAEIKEEMSEELRNMRCKLREKSFKVSNNEQFRILYIDSSSREYVLKC